MKYQTHYVIRPSERLMRKLDQYRSDIADLFREPVVWSLGEGGISGWSEEDYTTRVKLVFLVSLRADYPEEGYLPDDLEQLLGDLLGKPLFDEHRFDEWWEIERLPGIDAKVESLLERLDLRYLMMLAKPDRRIVDSWLRNIIEKKKVTESVRTDSRAGSRVTEES